MFDFFDELFGEIEKHSYRYQVDSGKKIVIQGHKNILRIEESTVIVGLKCGELTVCGQNLRVSELGSKQIKIVGKIFSVCASQNSFLQKSQNQKTQNQGVTANEKH